MTQLPQLDLGLLAAAASAIGAGKYRDRIRREEQEDEALRLRRREQHFRAVSERERLQLARKQAKASRQLADRQQGLREFETAARLQDTAADNQRQAGQLDYYNRQQAAREEAQAFEQGVSISKALAEAARGHATRPRR